MAHVFRSYHKHRDPETGKLVYTLDEHGERIPHEKWRYSYKDHMGRVHSATGHKSERKTQDEANLKQALEDEIRRGLRPRPKASDEAHPFPDLLREYLAWGKAQGRKDGRGWSDSHEQTRERFLQWWGAQLKLKATTDLLGILPRVESLIRDELSRTRKRKARKDAPARKLSQKYVQNRVEALVAFCHWAVKRGYLAEYPLQGLRPLDTTPQKEYRELNLAEIRTLLAGVGAPRRLLYAVGLCTGLRANEIASLRVEHLNGDRQELKLERTWTKNRKGGTQFIPSALAELLKAEAKGRGAKEKLVHFPFRVSHAAREIRRDCVRLGIPLESENGTLVFHSLRVTFSTLVSQCGATPKEQSVLTRHSTKGDLAQERYTKTQGERLQGLVERVGRWVLGDAAAEVTADRPHTPNAEPEDSDSGRSKGKDETRLQQSRNGGGEGDRILNPLATVGNTRERGARKLRRARRFRRDVEKGRRLLEAQGSQVGIRRTAYGPHTVPPSDDILTPRERQIGTHATLLAALERLEDESGVDAATPPETSP